MNSIPGDDRKYTVTIAIPAHNEEVTIGNILSEILAQEKNNFVLEEISVYCDGCTDKTAEVARRKQNESPLLRVIEGENRQGKIRILNQIFADSKSDFLIVLDADIGLGGPYFLETLVDAASLDENAQMLAAHQIPLRPRNFVGRLLYASYAMWDEVRLLVPKKDHVQNYYGAATLYKKALFAKMQIPDESMESRTYQYVMATREGGFSYVDDAVIYYWPPISIYDFYKHSERAFGTDQLVLKAMFGDAVLGMHIIPWRYKFRGIIRYFLRDPLYAPFGLLLNFTMSRLTKILPVRKTQLWTMATSTKRPLYTQRKLKIFISNFDDPKNPVYRGGGACAIHEIAKRLGKKSEITILCGNYKHAQNEIIDGVAYRHIGFSFLGPRTAQLLFHFILPFHVLAADFDLWIEGLTPPFSTSFTPLYTRKPVIALVHMLAAKDMSRKYRLPFSVVQNFGLKFYRSFIVLTDESAREIREKNFSADIEIIANGVYLPSVSIPNENKSGHLSFIGRIEINQKGLDILIAAYGEIAKQSDIRLAIAGFGAKRDISSLQILIKKSGLDGKIDIKGHLAGADKDRFLRETRIGIIPSRYETFSLTALEMMSYKIPVVTFDIPGVRWISDGAVVKVKGFSEKALADAVLKLLADQNYFKKISQAVRREAEKYNWDDIILLYEKFIWKKILLKK